MTSDQHRTVDALTLFSGGWANLKKLNNHRLLPDIRMETRRGYPNYIVYPDGSAVREDGTRFTQEEIQLAVYGEEVG